MYAIFKEDKENKMTKKELKEILAKKGFNSECNVINGYYIKSINIYDMIVINIPPKKIIPTIEINGNTFPFDLKNLTEKRIDEILRQAIKIKTALEIIKQITTGNV
ncbi:MAG: hypothetical protein BWY78_00052 [Alphaproteobacteria bacterium ADurb.Bin438]|nr:MAG: hypothetical protein BWY78_00052 [Alphaproteobacteria bacterium ADurb.Bin438]